MAIKAQSQTTLIDLTDGYSVVLTNESYTWLGTTNTVDGTQTTTCKVQALRGTEQVNCTIGKIDCPTGLSIVSDTKKPVPTLTVTATSALKTSGSVMIPVKIGDLTIEKTFSWTIAFKGTSVSISESSVTYQASDSGTTTPTGTWSPTVPSVPEGKFLWTKTVVAYSDGKSTTAYSVSRAGANGAAGKNGTSVTITKTEVTYQTSGSGTDEPTGTWGTSVPSVAAGQFLWTRTIVTYSDGKSTTSYSVSRSGTNGKDGQDALTLVIESSAGMIFKNTAVATTLTAKVFRAGTELTAAQIAQLGKINWYKDGATTAVASGQTLTVSAGDVTDKATYTAELEG